MGFLKRFGKKLKSDIAGGLDLLSAGFSHPIITTKALVGRDAAAIKGVVAQTKKEGPLKTSLRTGRTTVLAAGTLLGGGTAVGRAIVSKAVIPKTVGGAVKVATVGSLGTLVLAKSPTARKKALKTVDFITDPTTQVEAADVISRVIEGEKVSPKEALKTGGVIAGGVALLGAGVLGAKAVKGALPKGLPKPSALPTKDIAGSGIPAPNKDLITKPLGMTEPEKSLGASPAVDIDIEIVNKVGNKRFINTGAVVNP